MNLGDILVDESDMEDAMDAMLNRYSNDLRAVRRFCGGDLTNIMKAELALSQKCILVKDEQPFEWSWPEPDMALIDRNLDRMFTEQAVKIGCGVVTDEVQLCADQTTEVITVR